MHLKVVINEAQYVIDISEDFMAEAEDFFKQLDKTMDQGWQMSRRWVEYPSDLQRCQIAADKILSGISQENPQIAELAAAYILKKIPAVRLVEIDTAGDITQTQFQTND